MVEKEYKEFFKNENLRVISLDEILNITKDLKITSIVLSEYELYKSKNGLIKIMKTDYEHPFTIEKRLFGSGNRLYIDLDWYIKNQSKTSQIICNIINNTILDELTIYSGNLINNKIIETLGNNKILKEITLGSEENQYTLTNEDYIKLKNSNIESIKSDNIDSSLSENFDKIIYYNSSKRLIDYYTYEKLNPTKPETIYISKSLANEDIKNIKYINTNIIFQLIDEAVFDVAKISNKLKQLNKNNKIILKITDKNKFNKYLGSNEFNFENVFVGFGNSSIPISTYINYEKMLYQMIESATDLSTFEKFIYAFNITKKFKQYKENEKDKMAARNLYDVLMNEYIVCVGYSNLFGDLLDKLNIPNTNLTIDVDTSYDDVKFDDFVPEEKNVSFSGHSRRYVYINDEKYGINGFYFSDPTWDSNLEHDYYNHLIMTDDEVTKADRFIKINRHTVEELFNIDSMEEFYHKINFLIKNYKIEIIIKKILEVIEELDINYYNYLINQEEIILLIDKNELKNTNKLLNQFGNYILSKTNKIVSGNTIMSAVEEIYRKSYGYKEEDIEKVIRNVRKENSERQERVFPMRYSEYESGKREIYSNEKNKFKSEKSNKVI